MKPLFTYSILPKGNVCQWFSEVDAPWHKRHLFDTYFIEQTGSKGIYLALCTYCFICWYADMLKGMKKIGLTKVQIMARLPEGPTNADNVKGIRKVDSEERKARRQEKADEEMIAGMSVD